MELQFPSSYRGVALEPVEREVIAEFLNQMLQGVAEDQRRWIEHLFVADALFMFANELIDEARAEGDAQLAQAGCESAERASRVASDEPIYVYRLARCLERAGAQNAVDYYRLFLKRSALDVGTLGRSPMEAGDFQNAIAYAKERVGIT